MMKSEKSKICKAEKIKICKAGIVWMLVCAMLVSSFGVTVKGAATPRIVLSQNKAIVYKECSIYLTAKVKNLSNKNVRWTSSNPKVATVDADGWIIGRKLGTAKITCISKANKKVKATCNVTVKKDYLKLNKEKVTLAKGKKVTLYARYASWNSEEGVFSEVTFTSSNPKVAKVGKYTGKVTAVRKGTATITCRNIWNDIHKATCKVTVK